MEWNSLGAYKKPGITEQNFYSRISKSESLFKETHSLNPSREFYKDFSERYYIAVNSFK